MKIWIKLFYVFVVRNILKICCLFRIKDNRIVSYSYNGTQYSCNPKYIIEYLLNKSKNDYQIIFAFNDVDKFKYLEKEKINLVKFKSLKFFYYSLTCKIFINNDVAPSYIPFRNGQFILTTWHGGGAYKKCGLDIINNLPYKILLRYSSKYIKGTISSCSSFTETFHEAFLIENQKFLNIGMPRNDLFFYEEKMKKVNIVVRKKYDIENKECIILYAPTWRDDNREIVNEISKLDVLKAFEKIKNEKIKILIRAHYNTQKYHTDSKCIDVTDYPDMQELLCAADILITDYSSCMWDFSLMYKPCFIYATDIDQYKQERDFYTPMSEWPFPIATNTDELINNILNFNQEEYVQKVKQHHKDLGSFEDGHACERVCKLIEDIIDGKVKN